MNHNHPKPKQGLTMIY